MAEKGRGATEWLSCWGFAALVAAAAIAAITVAATVAMPPDVPSFALQAAPVYRLEVGGAVFAGAYLASLALVLALNNRGFSEIGASGVKAADLAGNIRSQSSREQAESIAGVLRQLEELETIARRPRAVKVRNVMSASSTPDERSREQILEDLARHKRQTDEAFERYQRGLIKLEVLEELEELERRRKRFGLFGRH